MTEADEPKKPEPSGRYENILRNTLMKRTGKSFQRNIGSAPVPKQEHELNHDDVANQIFDNILQRSRSNSPSDEESTAQSDREQVYGDVLDDILFGDDLSADVNSDQVTVSEANPYNNVLKKTLNKNLKALVAALEAQTDDYEGTPIDQDYAAVLDEVLGPTAQTTDGEIDNANALSRTLYHQHLDEILWPSQFETEVEKKSHPPINEEKIRSVVAEYLHGLIVPEVYGLIAVQRQVFDEKYSQYWLREMLGNLDMALQELETEFTIWVFMNHLDLIKPLITQEFVERFRLMIEHMLPQKKRNENLFERTLKNQEQRLVFDKMINNKFEDVRRILKHYHKQFNKDDAFHLYNFFRIKLPEFLDIHRQDLMVVLKYRTEKAASNPFLGSLLYFLFFSEAFTDRFQALQEDQKAYQKSFLTFLRERAETVGDADDHLLPMTLICMDLYHEKATEFKPKERESLGQALDILSKLLHYVPETSFEKESFLNAFSALVEHRVQSQYHVETSALQKLTSEIGQLAYQANHEAQNRLNHLNAIYERHHQEINDIYHKRRDTLEKLNQIEGPAGQKRSRKEFIQRKVKACQQYLQRKLSKQRKLIQVTYCVYDQGFLGERKESLIGAQTWDNDFEEKVMQNVFNKANIVLKSLNESKSTVQFNLKLLFNGEPQQEVFLACFFAIGKVLDSLSALEGHPSYDYVHTLIYPYIEGLKFNMDSEPLELNFREQIGYIIAYLGHVSHIKLLINRQFRQVIFDFQTLYGLAHALFVLDLLHHQAQSSFEEHYQQAMPLAWDCLMAHMILVGKGQYNFVSNPLVLHDYSWQPALSGFGVSLRATDAEDNDFELIEMTAPEQLTSSRKSRFALPETKEQTRLPEAVSDKRKALPPANTGRFRKDENTSSRRFLPPAEGDISSPTRRIPLSPGKFELYSSPGRRPPVTPANSSFSIEEDDFYKVLGQTQEIPKKERNIPAAEPVHSVDDAQAFDLLSFGDDDNLDQSQTQVFQRKTEPIKPEKPSVVLGQSSQQTNKRKRWLEITPVPEENQKYDEMLDDILNSWDDEEQTKSGASANTARRVLKREPLKPADSALNDSSMSKKTVRRRFDFDD